MPAPRRVVSRNVATKPEPMTVDKAARMAATRASLLQTSGTMALPLTAYTVLSRMVWTPRDHRGYTVGTFYLDTEIGRLWKQVTADADFKDEVALAFIVDLLHSVGFTE